MPNRVAVITGITGQDGSYLAELLLDKGYTVYGLIRRSSLNMSRIAHIMHRIIIQYGDVTDTKSIHSILSVAGFSNPSFIEFYNLAAEGNEKRSFELPQQTLLSDGAAVLNLLEVIRISPLRDRIRFFQASTSRLFGNVQEFPQKETTPFCPRSPYGAAKQYAFWMVKLYRETHGIFAINGIMFNHDSPRRNEEFLTQKIVRAVKDVKAGLSQALLIGNLNARRDWGHSKDYVEAMWRMLQTNEPRDWVVATGVQHSVRDFVQEAFKQVGIIVRWIGSGIEEVGICELTGKTLVRVNPVYFKQSEADFLLGDSTAIRRELGWTPAFTFEDLVKDMMSPVEKPKAVAH